MAIQSRGFAPAKGGVISQARGILSRMPAKPGNNPLLNPGQPLSGQALLQAAQALTGAQINGPKAELAAQIAAQQRQTAGTMKLAGGYYNTLGGQAQQGVTDEQGIASNLNQELQDIAGRTNTQLQAIGQSATNSLLAHSPQGDGGLSTPALGALTAEVARQQGLAAQQQGASQTFGANQGANYSGLAATGLSTNALAGTQALKGIAQSGTVKDQPLLAKIADLDAQRGSLLATNEGKLRQQEVNNQIAQQGLGIKVADINAQNQRTQATILGENQRNTASNNAANTRSTNSINAANTRAQNAIDAAAKQGKLTRQNRIDIARINHAATAAGKPPVYTPTGARTLPPVQQQRVFGEIDTIRALIPQIQQPLSKAEATQLDKAGYNYKEKQVLTEGQIRHLLSVGVANGTRYDPALVDSAYALAGWGYLTQKQIVELNKLGLIVGNRYKRQPTNRASGGPGTNQGGAPPGNHA